MEDEFKIYVEQLRTGQIETIDEKFTPDFLEVHEKDLDYKEPVIVKGKAYLADSELVINLDISTKATVPCTICTEPVKVDVNIRQFYHAVPLSEIKSGIYNFKEILREAVILDTPEFAECGGKCPRRKEVKKYLKRENPQDKTGSENDGYHPFSNLKWDK